MKNKTIMLIGFMGSGKTTVGKQLASDLGIPFEDTDERIEARLQTSISDVFASKGEAYFRDEETKELKLLLGEPSGRVISAGGGLPVRPENRALMKQLGTVVYLTASVEILAGRLAGDTTRPKLQGGNLKERIIQLMEQREEIYRSCADHIIETDHLDAEQVCGIIRSRIGEK